METKNIFKSHELSDQGKSIKEVIDQYFFNAFNAINFYLLDSREKSVAITKLQEAAMWTTRAICEQDTNEVKNEQSI